TPLARPGKWAFSSLQEGAANSRADPSEYGVIRHDTSSALNVSPPSGSIQYSPLGESGQAATMASQEVAASAWVSPLGKSGPCGSSVSAGGSAIAARASSAAR